MKEFIKKICDVYPLSEQTTELFLNHMETVILPKGHLLMKDGKVEYYTYFVVKGFARGFFYKGEKDITLWFASSGMTLLSMNAYLYEAAGYENIELLEECELLKISNEQLNRLFEENIEMANWGRRMSDVVILGLEKAFMERNFMPASQRYHLLVEHNPGILLKTPLRHLASYLGISQVSLSRIRAGMQ